MNRSVKRVFANGAVLLKEGKDEGLIVRSQTELKRVWNAGGFPQLSKRMFKVNVFYG